MRATAITSLGGWDTNNADTTIADRPVACVVPRAVGIMLRAINLHQNRRNRSAFAMHKFTTGANEKQIPTLRRVLTDELGDGSEFYLWNEHPRKQLTPYQCRQPFENGAFLRTIETTWAKAGGWNERDPT